MFNCCPQTEGGRDYFQLVKDLRTLGAVLRKLEDRIAALAAQGGERGYTAPGEFLFELFASINLTGTTYIEMTRLLDDAREILESDSAQQGRRHVLLRACLTIFQCHSGW